MKHIIRQFYQPRITWNMELYAQKITPQNKLPVNTVPKYITPDYLNKYITPDYLNKYVENSSCETKTENKFNHFINALFFASL